MPAYGSIGAAVSAADIGAPRGEVSGRLRLLRVSEGCDAPDDGERRGKGAEGGGESVGGLHVRHGRRGLLRADFVPVSDETNAMPY
jgi:hypothetical protein